MSQTAIQPIECLRTGTHTDVNGQTVSFGAADLAAIAAHYDPAVHEAPIVVGHPRLDAPAYGWAGRFEVQGERLVALPAQVEPQFAELVNQGRFKRVSLALYAPQSKANPRPGTWYPKHIGFLGAHAPAIKGLKSVQFAEDHDGVVLLAGYDDTVVARLFRALRDWLIGTQGQEAADRVLPSWDVDMLQQSAAVSDAMAAQGANDSGHGPAYAEPQGSTPTGDAMSDQRIAELTAQLEAARSQAAAHEAALRERQQADAAAAATQRRESALAFAESLAGRVSEDGQAVIAAVLEVLATPRDNGAIVAFGEGDAAQPLADAFRGLFDAAKPLVQFGEVAARRAEAADGQADDDLQLGEHVDAGRLALHKRVRAHMSGHPGVSYADALEAVKRG